MGNTTDFVIVNALMRQALVAVQEIVGKNGLAAVLCTSNLAQYIDHLPPDDLSPSIKSSGLCPFEPSH